MRRELRLPLKIGMTDGLRSTETNTRENRSLGRRRFLQSLGVGLSSITAGCVLGYGQQSFQRQCDDNELLQGPTDVLSSQSWPQYQFNAANTGYNPQIEGVSDPELAWRFASCTPMRESSPTVVDDQVFVSNAQQPSIYAFDIASGEVNWTVARGGSELAPAVVNDTVYVSGRDVYALDASTGEELWLHPTEGNYPSRSPPTVHGETVYVVDDAERPMLLALSTVDGDILWKHRFMSDSWFEFSPAVDDGYVYFGNHLGELISLDADSGEVEWRLENIEIESSPVVGDDLLLFSSSDDSVTAVSLDGEVLWETAAKSSMSPPVLVDNTVFVASGDRLTAIDAHDGTVDWVQSYPHELGTPVAAGSSVYVGHTEFTHEGPMGGVLAVDAASGDTNWRFETREIPAGEGGPYSGTLGSPAVVDGGVVVTTGAGDIYVIGDNS